MKNLFAIIKDSTINNYDDFIIRKISQESEEKFNSICEETNNLVHKKLSPNWLTYGSLIVAMLAFLIMFKMLIAEDGFLHALETRGFIFYISCALFVIGAIVFVCCIRKNKKGDKDPEMADCSNRLTKTFSELYFELEVPETAPSIDVMLTITKLNKNGEQKFKKFSILPYVNQEVRVFVEKDSLCLADCTSVLAIPLSGLKGIKKINKLIQFPRWNKTMGIKSPEFKPYKIYVSNGYIWCKPYYEIDFEVNGEEYYFYIACYDKDRFVKTLGMELPEIDTSKK